MANFSLLSLTLCLLVLFHTSLAQHEHEEPQLWHSEQQNNEQLEYELWDQNNEQLQYAGVATIRYRIQQQDGKIAIVVVGNGYIEDVIPGPLAETFQSSQQSEAEAGQRYRDQHHRIERVEHGDIDADVTDLRNECRIERIDALEPTHRLESEAGVIEFWDQNLEEFECTGVAVSRYRIRPRGLRLPSYANAPNLVYVVRGSAIFGFLIPGCPETYQSFEVSKRYEGERRGERGERLRDQHQRIKRIERGDILAVPHGIAHWIYNDGDEQLEFVAFDDTGNNNNQLDQRYRNFYLAGNATNILSGFDTQLLAEVQGVDEETARRLQGQDDNRGPIVHVEGGLEGIRPSTREEEEEKEQGRRNGNGFEENLCSARLRENLEDPTRADVYSGKAGRISSLNSLTLPILRYLRLSAERGVLNGNAFHLPHYDLNANSIIYVIRGKAKMQIVGNRGQRVYDGDVREGQLLVVPQNFAVLKQANNEGFEWVSFKTDDNALSSYLAGRTSVLRDMPEDVLANAYQIPSEEARRIKYGSDEAVLLSSKGGSRERVAA